EGDPAESLKSPVHDVTIRVRDKRPVSSFDCPLGFGGNRQNIRSCHECPSPLAACSNPARFRDSDHGLNWRLLFGHHPNGEQQGSTVHSMTFVRGCAKERQDGG